jgi:hypothetical protein
VRRVHLGACGGRLGAGGWGNCWFVNGLWVCQEVVEFSAPAPSIVALWCLSDGQVWCLERGLQARYTSALRLQFATKGGAVMHTLFLRPLKPPPPHTLTHLQRAPSHRYSGTWRNDVKRSGGGFVFDSASHWIRPLTMWMGPIDSIVGTVGRSVAHMPGESMYVQGKPLISLCPRRTSLGGGRACLLVAFWAGVVSCLFAPLSFLVS